MIGGAVTPFNRALQFGAPMSGHAHQWLNPATPGGAALLDRIVNQQAQIVAYVDDYVLLIATTLPALLLLLLMRLLLSLLLGLLLSLLSLLLLLLE